MRAAPLLVGLVAAVTLAACQGQEPVVQATERPPAFQPCPPSTAMHSAENLAHPLPDTALACAVGKQPVQLARLGRPAVINLWASWCAPCRKELPELQRFADSAGSELVVLGVVSGDTEAAATAAARDFGISFPAVLDPQERLRRDLGLVGLPMTLFVDAQGQISYVYHSGEPLTVSTLEELSRQHLGVVVS
jgi:thiol-disulfide isomerase/thioredoxin